MMEHGRLPFFALMARSLKPTPNNYPWEGYIAHYKSLTSAASIASKASTLVVYNRATLSISVFFSL